MRPAIPSDRRTFQSPWSWVCVAGRCERRAVRSSRTSLASCIALCGGNTRLLWPRPTGNVVLGEESVIVHLQQIEFVTVNTSDQETRNLLEHAKDVFIGDEFIFLLLLSFFLPLSRRVPRVRITSSFSFFFFFFSKFQRFGHRLFRKGCKRCKLIAISESICNLIV